MTALQEVLYDFAMETRAPALLHTQEAELRDNQAMADRARARLESMGSEMGDLAQRMADGLFTVSALREEAAFLAGLSMGLELCGPTQGV